MKVLWLIPQSIHTDPITPTLPGEIYNYLDSSPEISHKEMPQLANYVSRPDLIIFVGIAEGPYFVKSDVFKKMKAPVIHFCCDASCPGWTPGIKYYNDTKPFVMTVNIDGNDNWLKGEKDLTLWCPLDPSFYKPLPKTIRLGWAGGLGPERQRVINDLGDMVTVMPRNEKIGSYQEYANFLSRCKIAINMAKSGSGLALQRKNRVTEAGYAGCLLLEERGAPSHNWFELGKEYLDYGSAEEVRSIVNSISDQEILEIADRFQRKVLSLYSPNLFWEKVLTKLNGTNYSMPTL